MEKSTLSPVKQALLEHRLKSASDARMKGLEIPRRPDPNSAPVSFAQRQMWVIDQVTKGNTAYGVPIGYRLHGRLDVRALEKSFNEVIKRHESLRTTFSISNGEPLQVIHPELTIAIAVTELDSLPRDRRESRLQDLASRECLKPFDLSRLPLIRVSLFKLDQEEHALIVSLHHIIGDGLSFGPMLSEIDRLYRAFTAGVEPRLPDLAVQYADFSHWQRQTMGDEAVYAGQIEFWRRQLGGTLPVAELPGDRPRPPLQSFKGSNVFFTLTRDLAQELKLLGTRHGCTFFMTVLAAFQVLLHRYSGAQDIVIGTPVAARTRRELEPLIGNFLNMAALRCDLSGNPTFVDVLRRTRETTLNAFSNSDLPFEALLKHLTFERDASRNPIFQVLIQVLSAAAPRIGDLDICSLQFDPRSSQLDLSLLLYEEAGGYWGRIEYCTDLFDAQTIQRMSAHYSQLLQAIVRNPQQPVSDLRMVLPAERRQLLDEWNRTAVPYPDRCLHDLIEEQARRTPDETAVVFEETRLTYAELDWKAAQLARRLRDLGVGLEDRVGLCIERSLDMVVGMLGILKAGGAYVPIDSAYPPDRIAFMLADADARVLLTQTRLLDILPKDSTHTICLDTFPWTQAKSAPLDRISIEPGHLAYVIYTSGSTGRPKGVCIEHRNIVNYVMGIAERLQLVPGMHYATVSTIAADLGNTVIFPALVTGGCLHIIAQERAENHVRLAEYFSRHPIDVLKIVPSHLAALQAGRRPEAVLPRRRLILGGETSRCDWIARLRDWAPGCEIHNHYGPTEATVGALTYQVGSNELTQSGTLPVGRPLPNVRIYILDAHGQPVPIGVQGELCIAGCGIGRGYLNRPELTAEKFVRDPFSVDAPGRLYRTGDLARYLTDGTISFAAGSITRSRSTATVSSWARLREFCASSPACATPS